MIFKDTISSFVTVAICFSCFGCSGNLTTSLEAQDVRKSSQTEQSGRETIEVSVPEAENDDDVPQTGFAVVELFTSQGCSSCPSADANLAHIREVAVKRSVPIYPLSFHVDYWNKLGWDDPFSSSGATTRQRRYARRFQTGRIYTPQMVINGTTEFVGSNRRNSAQAIQTGLQSEAEIELNVEAIESGETITVTWDLDNVNDEAIFFAVLVQKNARRSVNAGENNGRTLNHVNVVRDFKPVDPNAGKTDLQLPKGGEIGEFEVIAFLQPENLEPILAATKTSILPESR